MKTLKMPRKMGRPKGSVSSVSITQRLRKEIYSALDILDRRGQPLDGLLADQMADDPAKVLSLLSKFIPQEVNINGEGSQFAVALGEVALRIADQTEAIRDSLPEGEPNDTQLIDITPEKTDDQQ